MENNRSKINPLSHFYNMPLYESGESAIQGKENVVKLSANENMNGPCNEVLNQFAYYSKIFSSIQIAVTTCCDTK